MKKLLSVQEAAEKLGVSPSTFKRCCELHQITLYRTPGGHRRIAEEDLDSLIHVAGCRAPKQHEQEDSVAPEAIVDLLRRGEAKTLADRIWSMIRDSRDLPNLLEDTLAPALWSVGTMWLSGHLPCYEEKISSQTASAAMDIIASRIPVLPIHSPVIVGGTLSPSRDTLASKMLWLSALARNFRAWDLGSGLTPSVLAEAAVQLRASCVWVCHTHVDDTERLVTDHDALRIALPNHIRIAVGGGGLSPSLRRLLKHAQYHSSIASFLNSIDLCSTCVHRDLHNTQQSLASDSPDSQSTPTR